MIIIFAAVLEYISRSKHAHNTRVEAQKKKKTEKFAQNQYSFRMHARHMFNGKEKPDVATEREKREIYIYLHVFFQL